MSKGKKKILIEKAKLATLLSILGLEAILKSTEYSNRTKETTLNKNLTGKDNVNAVINLNLKQDDFAVLHLNSTSYMSMGLLCEKIEKVKKADSSICMILDTKAGTLNEMYKEIDYLQALIKKYSTSKECVFDMPIYCNIDSIMENKNLNNAQKKELINAFLDKSSRSDMYIGLYGKDSNLVECKELGINIDEYDAFLIQDSKTIKYNGTHNITKDLDGNIVALYDLSKAINEKNLNVGAKLVSSAAYVVQDGESFHSLAFKYGLSENDLRKYNSKIDGELSEGQTIFIPNKYESYDTKTNKKSYSYAIARGIDISDYQGTIDWERVDKTSDFVIVEVARDFANYEDESSSNYLKSAISQIKNVKEKEIDLGLYFLIQKGMNMDIYTERIEKYLSRLDSELKENNVELEKENIPVFLDFETYYSLNNYNGLLSLFKEACEKHGYKKIGIYANKTTLDSIASQMKEKEGIILKNTDYIVWLSGGKYYSGHEDEQEGGLKLEEIEASETVATQYYVPSICQVTNICEDTGAVNSMKHCDVDFLYDENVFESSFNKENTEEQTSKDTFEYPYVQNLHLGTISSIGLSSTIAMLCVYTGCKIRIEKEVQKILTKRKEKEKIPTDNN